MLQLAKEVAIAAAYEAGRMIKHRFGSLIAIDEKDEHGDVVTEVDHAAETIILTKIKSVFPEHRIRSEEAGDNDITSEWLWLVDPLDGTNNFAVAMPLFAVSITLMHESRPVVAVIYEPMTDRLFTSVAGEGARCNGQALLADLARPMKKARVGWIQGHQVQNRPTAVKLRHHIDVEAKRMMRLWAPTLQWSMLARGDLDGIIVYDSEGEDLYSGILLVQEAGYWVMDYNGELFNGVNEKPFLIACLPAHAPYFLDLVKTGLAGSGAGKE
ncbi:MAG: inositol monophosphatase [Paenibacillus sp.]|nr:inositol monophosphatase [Paenibacillus sp.]